MKLKKIDSFKINHLMLDRGLYVSRKDKVGNSIITTFDIRMRAPYKDVPMNPAAMHTIEHLGASYLRTNYNNIVYFGPMGCLTGFYLILDGDYESKNIMQIIEDLFEFIVNFEGMIPGATKEECGNYSYQDLDKAKVYSQEYLESLREFGRVSY